MSERHRAMAAQLVRVHADLREQLTRIRAGSLDRSLAVHCLAFCDYLHEHHTREDAAFTEFESSLGPVVARLRAEHEGVSATLGEIRRLLASDEALDQVKPELDRLAGRLEDHFAYEEEQLLPVLNA